MASTRDVLVQLTVIVIVVCLSQRAWARGSNRHKYPKPIEYEKPCPRVNSDDKRCCYENHYYGGRVTSSWKHCYQEPGCCGGTGSQYCCHQDKLTVYLTVGLTLGALALLAIIFGIITCVIHRMGFTWVDFGRDCQAKCEAEEYPCCCCCCCREESPVCEDISPPWLALSPGTSPDSAAPADSPSGTPHTSTPTSTPLANGTAPLRGGATPPAVASQPGSSSPHGTSGRVDIPPPSYRVAARQIAV